MAVWICKFSISTTASAARALASLGPAAHLYLPLLPFARELTTENASFPEVMAAWMEANLQPGQRVLVAGNIDPLMFHADVPLGRLAPASRIRDPNLKYVVAWDPAAPPPDLTGYAWYLPECNDIAGMPADASAWLGVEDWPQEEIPVAPCPRNNPADPRLHQFTPRPAAPPTRLRSLLQSPR